MVSFSPGPPSAFFLALPDKIIKQCVVPAANKGAAKGKQVAQSKARRDTGAMADSTDYVVQVSGSKVTITATNDTDYWMHHEWGTMYISAQPFIEPGMKAAQDETLNQIESNFRGLKF